LRTQNCGKGYCSGTNSDFQNQGSLRLRGKRGRRRGGGPAYVKSTTARQARTN
jgi:hypothetical protein